MIDYRHAATMWRKTNAIARSQIVLDKCPCCGAPDPEYLFNLNNYTGYLFIAPGLKRSRFSLCHQCGVVFAAKRTTIETANKFYDLFKEGKAVSQTGGEGRGQKIARMLGKTGLLKPKMSVLHVRCGSGALLRALREAVPDAALHGLEPLEENIAAARASGFAVERLPAGDICSPFGVSYDLIVAYHQLTHAIEPRRYIEKMRGFLKPGGSILLHGEVNHAVIWDMSNDRSHSRNDANRYHLQMFTPASFEYLLADCGLAYKQLELSRDKMMYLASPGHGVPVGADANTIDRTRAMIARWQGVRSARRSFAWRVSKTFRYLRHRADAAEIV